MTSFNTDNRIQLVIDSVAKAPLKYLNMSAMCLQIAILIALYQAASPYGYGFLACGVYYLVGLAVCLTIRDGLLRETTRVHHTFQTFCEQARPLVSTPLTVRVNTYCSLEDLRALQPAYFLGGLPFVSMWYYLSAAYRDFWGYSATEQAILAHVPVDWKYLGDESYWALSFFHELAHYEQEVSDKAYQEHYCSSIPASGLSELDADLRGLVRCYEHGYMDAYLLTKYRELRANVYLNGNPVYLQAMVFGALFDENVLLEKCHDLSALREYAREVLLAHDDKTKQLEAALHQYNQYDESFKHLLPPQFQQWFNF